MRYIVVVAAALMLASCGDTEPVQSPGPAASALPEVNWEEYPEDLQEAIDRSRTDADCPSLEQLREEWSDEQVSEYIDASMEQIGCSERLRETPMENTPPATPES